METEDVAAVDWVDEGSFRRSKLPLAAEEMSGRTGIMLGDDVATAAAAADPIGEMRM